MNNNNIYLYPVFIRIWHFINAVMFLLLIITGFSMQYSTPDSPFIQFDLAVKLHDIGGLTVTFNYLLFFIGNLVTGNGKNYRIRAKGFAKELMAQIRYYSYGIFKGENPPFPINSERKFNPLQKFSYVVVMYFGTPILILTGLALFFPKIFDFVGLGSLIIADVIHVLMGIILTMFVLIHVYFSTIGTTLTSNFKSIITGWHEAGH